MSGGLLRRARTGIDSTISTVVTDVVRGIDDYRLIVCVMKVSSGADIVHVGVVAELIAAPVATLVADATVAEPIVHAAVKADCATPVAVVPQIHAVAPAPIAGRPKIASGGRLNPCARNPEVALLAISPVAWCPEVTFLRTNGLLI